MSHLLDVNFLVACGWRSHTSHRAARRWLEAQPRFYTCPLTHLGFLRVSMSAAFRCSFQDASEVLDDLLQRKGGAFVPDSLPGTMLPALDGGSEVTDAYLVALAKAHGVFLATLDEILSRKPWAAGIAVNPIER